MPLRARRDGPPHSFGAVSDAVLGMTAGALELFAIAAPGLEPLVAAELSALGATGIAAEAGGVAFRGDREAMYAANLHLRTASRIVRRLAAFRATAFHELERHARRIPWEEYLPSGARTRLRVTCRKSRLYHSDAVAERIADAIARRVAGAADSAIDRTSEDDDSDQESDAAGTAARGDDDAQLFIVRFAHDRCTVSVDASGALLHRRGYRRAVAKAPLRETLAAAALMGSGWRGRTPMLDPMCGSGTIAIEAALLARRMAPGRARWFSFMAWPDFDRTVWDRVHACARDAELPAAAVAIQASDRDAGATAAAASNAVRAGVDGDIEISTRAVSAIVPAAGAGSVVSNPPYGARIGESGTLRNLYAQLGRVAREKCPGWTMALLSADPVLERQVGLAFQQRFVTSNGGIRVRLVVAMVTESINVSIRS